MKIPEYIIFFSSLIDEKFPNGRKKMEESKLMITLSITHSLIQCESVGINEKKIVKKILFSSFHSFIFIINKIVLFELN